MTSVATKVTGIQRGGYSVDINIFKDGMNKKLSDIGIVAKDFILSSIEIDSKVESLEGMDGFRETDATFGSRIITVPFYLKGVDLLDFMLARDELFRLVTDKRPFYIQELRRPKYQQYNFVGINERYEPEDDNQELSQKRYLVRLSNIVEIEQTFKDGEGELVFTTIELPFAESVGTTLDDLTFTAEKWQVGQGLTLENPKYTHSTNTFSIYNAGDVTIDPRQLPLKIIYRGASNNLKITNLTTGDEWQYDGTSGSNDNITLDGIRSLKNDSSIFKDTNKKLISLKPGWNDFTLSDTSGSFLISFEHRFYYY